MAGQNRQKTIDDDIFIPPEETDLNFTYYDREIKVRESFQKEIMKTK